ncbi:pectin methylesterase [Aureobasidium pullulans]|uniref:pectinesterase n=1 Tax=Aureobasidium pullulans TaxID=5580 RepID=A0A4S9SNM0_AURPU|nr:pectin methylesterase [Aureobasidium pullulans]
MVTTKSLLSVFSLGLLGTAQAYSRGECQYPTQNPLQGCPQGTLLVGAGQKFTSIQSAVLSIPNNTVPYYILVLPGNYTEQVNVTRPGPLTLLAQTKYPNDNTKNSVNVIWHNATGTASTGSYDNAYTSTLTIAPTFNSSLTGSGPIGNQVPAGTPFGNTDFRAYNLNFINDYLPYSAGPSLALSVSYANAGFYYCGFYSYQDTVYIGKLGNAYMYNSTVAGQTDFLYGFGTLWIQSSLLSLRSCGGGITAWKGTNTTFTNHYGVYIHDSFVRAANSSLNIVGKCALGRPWNALHRSIFANTYLDDSIEPSGYIKWSATDPRVNGNTTMAEYKDYGPGWNATGRAAGNVTIVMTDAEYAPYSTLEKVFQEPFTGKFGNTKWIDRKPVVHGN